MPRSAAARTWMWALAWCGGLALVVAETAPVLGDWSRQVVGPYGGIDAVMQAGLLAWSRATVGTAAWTTTPLFHPVTGTLAFMDSLGGQALLVAPLRWLGVTAPASRYNAAYAGTLVLAGLAMAALWRAGGGRAREAGLAVVVLLGSPYTLSQLGHLNQLPMPCVLLVGAALLGAWHDEHDRPAGAATGRPRAAASGWRAHRWWWLLAVSLVAQAAWGWYGFAYAGVLLVTVPAVLGACAWRERRRRGVGAAGDVAAAADGGRRRWFAVVARAALPLALAVVAVFLLSAPYRDMHHRYPDFERSRADVRYDAANLQHLVEGGAYRLHAADLAGHGPRGAARYAGRDRQVLAFGWVATALAAWGFAGRRRLPERQRRAGYALLAAGAVGLVLSFGDSIRVPGAQARLSLPLEWLRDLVPAFRAYRACWRFSFLTVVAVAWWAAAGWLALARAGGGRRRGLVAIAALVLLVVESLPCGLPAVTLGFDGARRPLAGVPAGALLTLPAPPTEYDEDITEARWLLWALATGRRVTGGVSGWVPPETRALRRELQACEDGAGDVPALLARLRAGGVAGAALVARPGDERRVGFWRRELLASGADLIDNSPVAGCEVYGWGGN